MAGRMGPISCHISAPLVSHMLPRYLVQLVSGLETCQLVSKSKSGSYQNITSAHIHLVKTSQKPRPKTQGGEIDLLLERAAHTRWKKCWWLSLEVTYHTSFLR